MKLFHPFDLSIQMLSFYILYLLSSYIPPILSFSYMYTQMHKKTTAVAVVFFKQYYCLSLFFLFEINKNAINATSAKPPRYIIPSWPVLGADELFEPCLDSLDPFNLICLDLLQFFHRYHKIHVLYNISANQFFYKVREVIVFTFFGHKIIDPFLYRFY